MASRRKRTAARKPRTLAGATRHRGIERGQLLQSAAELFAQKGYHATSLDDIAGRLHIKKTTIYHYIDDKEDLLIEIHDALFTMLERTLVPIAKSALAPDEQLRRMIHGYIETITAHSDMCAVYYATTAMVMRASPGVSARSLQTIVRRGRTLEKLFERIIVDGQQRGLFRALTPRLVVLALLGMCEFVAYWFRLANFPPDKIAAEFALILETGIKSDGKTVRGAWPRPANIAEALEPAVTGVSELLEGVLRVSKHLARAEEQLEQGIAQVVPPRSRRDRGAP